MTADSWWQSIPPGPVLVVADNAAIARSARDWCCSFATAARVHRVRLAGTGDSCDVAAVAAEAKSLGAVAILGVGDHPTLALAAEVAATLGLPLVSDGIDSRARHKISQAILHTRAFPLGKTPPPAPVERESCR